MDYAVKAGVWELAQNEDTKRVSLLKYGRVVEEWDADRLYKHEELYDMLIVKTRERRGIE